jgi:hypothetical protein
MSRLASQAEMQYIPTQERIVPMIRSYLSFPEKGTTCLDPCCADGEALLKLCPSQYLFGVELHTGRGLAAKAREFVKVLIGPFENSVISNRAFGFLHVNPPYDWVTGGGQRWEELFLYRSTNYLLPRGVLEYLVPTSLFECGRGPDVYKFLLENYKDIQIFKYPQPEYSQFRQLIVFGVKKNREPIKASPEWFAKMVARITTGNIPELTMQEKPMYDLPGINPGYVKTFRISHYDIELAEADSKIMDILKGQSKSGMKTNLVAPFYLDKALLALLAVGGYIDGRMPGHFLTGKYENNEVEDVSTDPDSGDEVHSIRKTSSTVFCALCKNPDKDGSRIVEIR